MNLNELYFAGQQVFTSGEKFCGCTSCDAFVSDLNKVRRLVGTCGLSHGYRAEKIRTRERRYPCMSNGGNVPIKKVRLAKRVT